MSNILNHNRDLIDLIIYKGDYWDFHLHEGMEGGNVVGTKPILSTDCLSAYIDTTNPDCIWMGSLYSMMDFTWDNAKCDESVQYNVGITGVDNGFIKYEKDKITNKEFLDLYTNTILEFNYCDARLNLSAVSGNNKVYKYPYVLTFDNENLVLECTGGWFQGYFESADGKYAVLPHTIGKGWVIETVLKPYSDKESSFNTLNDAHPDNRGMFFYIGTRAENKWWKLYQSDETGIDNNQYVEDYIEMPSANDLTSYVKDSEAKGNDLPYVDYEELKTKNIAQAYDTPIDFSDYVEPDITLSTDKSVKTNDGFALGQPNIVEIETDNKFLLFDRSKTGITTKEYQEGDTIRLHYIRQPKNVNFFTLFHHGKNGYTSKTIDDYINEHNKDYDVYSDLYRNALGFQITDNGAIGFKYIVKDCENNEPYKTETLFTHDGVVSSDEWHTISIKIEPVKQRPSSYFDTKCQQQVGLDDKMKIHIYVDGKLRLSSKELPMLKLRPLDDLASRQWSVPYNISIGGGTQGLCDVIYMDYMKTPTEILPLEKEFGGSFVGLIKSFRFYTCPLTFQELQNNFSFDQQTHI